MTPPHWIARRHALALAAAMTAAAHAAPTVLEPVVVTATRTEAAPFDVPASITRIDGDELRAGRAQVNLSEGLGGVPGLLARDRQNYAQDVQISVRGFGARASFGIRGVRLYVDDIPATLPDGQGQITNVEIGTVGRVEVLRGPFSALYGNSSGGIISIYSQTPSGPPRVEAGVAFGSDGMRRTAASASGSTGTIGYTLGASRFETDGYRQHSRTERRLANARLNFKLGSDTQLTVIANSVDLPEAQDPLGLTRAQWQADPRGVDPGALSFDTRKTMKQQQGGLVLEHGIDAANTLRAMVYRGHRTTMQFQSIPVATQANALHPGGVIDLTRDYQGADLRWRWKGETTSVVAGIAADELSEHRMGRQNFIGTTLGVEGALRRDERNRVSNADPYLQAEWRPTPAWLLSAGVRRSDVKFRSTDAYITRTNPDDSGSASYSATLPVLGVSYAVDERLRVYATAGRGFETPTLNELAYRASGATGMNFALQASLSRSVEAGLKARPWDGGELTLALFQTGTKNEIVTQTNVGGRSTFQNAGATRRRGLEASGQFQLAPTLQAQLAATWLDARYRDGFVTCTATPCAAASTPIAAGNRIPGIARTSLFGALTWQPMGGWRIGAEARALSKVYVNDLNNDAAPGYATLAAHVGYQVSVGPWDLGALLRVDNLADRRYAGSVIVNDGNGRFFEPAPGRAWVVGGNASYRF
ncbi:TonB-dependent receptor [Roseateles asaccharophilus]|uniref:Iron complex outermembrane receptor protein n=1 Tax=Roseateles asaccharophilus TaxID=582607 RepID=A0ABU2AD60_9BURK|nr:TonB-dependent receptor [Roseateles asaccharophilus]MDR7335129.1 iron complex outermembrane receptor protein [Roseateles asaccharophilus]